MPCQSGYTENSYSNAPRYLVTGGAGFIGSHLVDRLISDGARVVVLDDLSTGKFENLNPAASFVRASILDTAAVNKAVADADGVFHLAARVSVQACIDNWMDSHKVNLVGTMNIMSAATDAGCPVVYASSAAVYGDRSAEICSEGLQERPISPYGADKLACEHQARSFFEVKSLTSVGLRFFNVYGPRQDPASPYAGVIARFIENSSKNVAHTVFGDGRQSRDFIEVSDIVNGLISAMTYCNDKAPKLLVANLCTGIRTDLLELASLIDEIYLNGRGNMNFMDTRGGDIRHSVGCNQKSAKILNFKASISLKEGLRRLGQ